jgi:Mrp family chromosome partitioning ATPase
VLSGPIPPNPTDLLESERLREVVREAEGEYELVIIDTPPTSVVSDAIPLVSQTSGVIVVVRSDKTNRDGLRSLRDQLANLDARLLGVVLNSLGRDVESYAYAYTSSYTFEGGSGSGTANGTTPATNGNGNGNGNGAHADDRGDAPPVEPDAAASGRAAKRRRSLGRRG